MYIHDYEVSNRTLDVTSNVEVLRPQIHLSGHAQEFPPGDRNIQSCSYCSYCLRGCRVQKEQLFNPSLAVWPSTIYRNKIHLYNHIYI